MFASIIDSILADHFSKRKKKKVIKVIIWSARSHICGIRKIFATLYTALGIFSSLFFFNCGTATLQPVAVTTTEPLPDVYRFKPMFIYSKNNFPCTENVQIQVELLQ